MATKAKGFRARSRHKLGKSVRRMPSVNKMLQEFELKERIQVVIEPAIHEGMPHPRFHGKSGIIREKRGRSYIVEIKDVRKAKLITCHPVHLKKVK
ncbi:MAG: 50S ribosomal protein L21e [Candidatus Altiarchaeota archaeon]|nr:50S ribosomal protein L21e [Candidatus Altiarchaeota archaeon]